MATSKLDADLVYPIRRGLEPADKDFDAFTYRTVLPGDSTETTIAIGQPLDTFLSHGIVAYPIYKVVDDRVAGQIGLYEVRDEEVHKVLDEDGALQPDRLLPPLLYPSSDAGSPVAGAAVDHPAAAAAPVTGRGTATDMETAKESAAARKAYRPARRAEWIQRFMRSAKYRTVENDADGNCLFQSIEQGLATVGRSVSIRDMREMLAAEATPDLFDAYSLQYAAAKTQFEDVTAATKRLTAESRSLRKRARRASAAMQGKILEEASVVTEQLQNEERIRLELEERVGEFEFMNGVASLEAMRAIIQSTEYWADTWAVSTLERLLNIKLIIFSKRAFEDDDTDNVLLCGQSNDSVLERRGKFEPDFYILLSLSGETSGNTHYELIEHEGKGAFTFAELPYQVRHLVLIRCLEKFGGPYSLIPDFVAALSQVQPAEDHAQSSASSPRGKAIFQMYGKSAGGPMPGQGTGETLGRQDPHDYNDLLAIPNWRRLIADDGPSAKDIAADDCAFCLELDGRRWATVRHYALAARYAVGNPEFSARLAYDSGDKLGRDLDLAARVTRGTRLRKGDPEPPEEDPDADQQEDEAARRARDVKFASGTRARAALLGTGNAALRLYTRGAPARDAVELMELRDRLRGKKRAPSKAT